MEACLRRVGHPADSEVASALLHCYEDEEEALAAGDNMVRSFLPVELCAGTDDKDPVPSVGALHIDWDAAHILHAEMPAKALSEGHICIVTSCVAAPGVRLMRAMHRHAECAHDAAYGAPWPTRCAIGRGDPDLDDAVEFAADVAHGVYDMLCPNGAGCDPLAGGGAGAPCTACVPGPVLYGRCAHGACTCSADGDGCPPVWPRAPGGDESVGVVCAAVALNPARPLRLAFRRTAAARGADGACTDARPWGVVEVPLGAAVLWIDGVTECAWPPCRAAGGPVQQGGVGGEGRHDTPFALAPMGVAASFVPASVVPPELFDDRLRVPLDPTARPCAAYAPCERAPCAAAVGRKCASAEETAMDRIRDFEVVYGLRKTLPYTSWRHSPWARLRPARRGHKRPSLVERRRTLTPASVIAEEDLEVYERAIALDWTEWALHFVACGGRNACPCLWRATSMAACRAHIASCTGGCRLHACIAWRFFSRHAISCASPFDCGVCSAVLYTLSAVRAQSR